MRAVLTFLALSAGVATGAEAVPSFARQTGLACYQCHVTFGAPVPDFTWTGFMFKMKGYRLPWAGQKFEAGSEGALSGNRMVVPVIPYLAFRFQSVFATQTRSSTGDWGNVTSNPTSRFSFFPGGPFGDNFSLWAELYETPDGSSTNEWGIGNVSFDEYDFRIVKALPGADVGLAFSTQGIREVGGFGPWPVGLTDYQSNGNYRGWAHPNRGLLMVYGLVGERFFAAVGAGPGEDNFDWARRLYVGEAALALVNKSSHLLWLFSGWQFGNDGIPILTQISPSRDGRQTWVYSDMVGGISTTRTGPGAGVAYRSSDIDKYYRSVNEVRYGFVDQGPHSLQADVRLSLNREDYLDAARVTHNAVGAGIRYTLNRTWGLDLNANHSLDLSFRDMTGLDHEISTADVEYSAWLSWRPAANVLFGLNYGNSPNYAVNLPAVTMGRSWMLNVDFLF